MPSACLDFCWHHAKGKAPELLGIGMITDAIWEDIDGDKDDDLINIVKLFLFI